jgi:RNA polymerase sigma factor (sigma-70 family)
MPTQQLAAREPRASLHPDRAMTELVDAARGGHELAWNALVRRYEPSLRGIARRFGLSPMHVDDVVQKAWVTLYEQIDRLRDPEALGGWLATTTRREALRLLQAHVREQLTDDPSFGDEADAGWEPQSELIAAERRAALADAIARLPDRHRLLMSVFLSRPGLDYQEISELTGIPTGSIGPIRRRCLARMADDPALRALREE